MNVTAAGRVNARRKLVLGRIANFDDSIHDLHELDEANNELNHDPNRDLANHDLQFMTHNS